MRKIRIKLKRIKKLKEHTQLEFQQFKHHAVDKSNVTRSQTDHLYSADVCRDLVSNKWFH